MEFRKKAYFARSFVLLGLASLCLANNYCPKSTYAKTILIDGTLDFTPAHLISDEDLAVRRYFSWDTDDFYFGLEIIDHSSFNRQRKIFFVSSNPKNPAERVTFSWSESSLILELTSTLDSDPDIECRSMSDYIECRVKNIWNNVEIIRTNTRNPLDYATICTLDFSGSIYQKGSDLVEQTEQIERMLAEDTTNTTAADIPKQNLIAAGALSSGMLLITAVIGIIFLFCMKVPKSVAFK